MQYKNVVEGAFVRRCNRFVAEVRMGNEIIPCHVKNTGRLAELLTENARVFLEKSENKARKYAYDLISVYRGDVLFNIDSVSPNKVVAEWIEEGHIFAELVKLQPEKTFKNSRFDFYIETKNEKIFMEVKGVTLEDNGVLLFPDAPTERGVKHLEELVEAASAGFGAYVVFVAKTRAGHVFRPNEKTHPAFGAALKKAKDNGVHILCLGCRVTENSLHIEREIPIEI